MTTAAALPETAAREGAGVAYDVFISYSTTGDYRLVRDLERFLETFLRNPLLSLHLLGSIAWAPGQNSVAKRAA